MAPSSRRVSPCDELLDPACDLRVDPSTCRADLDRPRKLARLDEFVHGGAPHADAFLDGTEPDQLRLAKRVDRLSSKFVHGPMVPLGTSRPLQFAHVRRVCGCRGTLLIGDVERPHMRGTDLRALRRSMQLDACADAWRAAGPGVAAVLLGGRRGRRPEGLLKRLLRECSRSEANADFGWRVLGARLTLLFSRACRGDAGPATARRKDYVLLQAASTEVRGHSYSAAAITSKLLEMPGGHVIGHSRVRGMGHPRRCRSRRCCT
jgi:hypothetical protein